MRTSMKNTFALFLVLAMFAIALPANVHAQTPQVAYGDTITVLDRIKGMLMELSAQVTVLRSSTTTMTVTSNDGITATQTPKLPLVKVTSPNGGQRFNSEKGGFNARWVAKRVAVDLYLTDGSGANRLTELGRNVRGKSKKIKLDWEYLAQEEALYRLQVCQASTTNCDVSNKPFTIYQDDTPTIQQDLLAPIIRSYTPASVPQKSSTRISLSGSNYIAVGKGGDLRIRIERDKKLIRELMSTDMPMTVFAGVYANPSDTNGTFLQFTFDATTLNPGVYQVSVYLDGKVSNKVNVTVLP